MTIRILLIDDHTLFRSGIRALLQRQPDFAVVDEAADGVEGLKRAKQHRPDVILLDLNMPGLSGLETLALLAQDLPDTAVLILTVSEEAEELASALRGGWPRPGSPPRCSSADSPGRRRAVRWPVPRPPRRQ